MKAFDPAVAIASAQKMTRRSELLRFREPMKALGAAEVVQAIDRRMDQLAAEEARLTIGVTPANLSVTERVHEAVRVLEALRAYQDGGRRHPASRTRKMIKERGEIGAVRQTVMTHHTSQGLEDLAAQGRLDCAFEQIILDFPESFDQAAVTKARANLDRRTKAPSAPADSGQEAS